MKKEYSFAENFHTYSRRIRLHGSLPLNVVTALKEESEVCRKQFDLSVLHRWYFERFDEFLEKYSEGPTHLSRNDVAQIVADSIRFWNNKRYTLVGYSIMPNHVHLVIDIGGYTNTVYKK